MRENVESLLHFVLSPENLIFGKEWKKDVVRMLCASAFWDTHSKEKAHTILFISGTVSFDIHWIQIGSEDKIIKVSKRE